ncbi:MAG: class I SAM-dependent methyltransferase [Candidatus Promineifilaceae bacterium]|nr:class I SAM-dependent methyltransferase [Candidatus Promineifilaceae bacterium]
MPTDTNSIEDFLWRIYRRPDPPTPWLNDGNLPWNDPDFSRRMLREHLDQSHGAASRADPERELIVNWFWEKLALGKDKQVLDVTCGPGLYAVELARRGCLVEGIDFSPASIQYARDLAAQHQVSFRCRFIEQDVRAADFGEERFDAALFIYGQLAVFPREQAQELLAKIARALKPGGMLCVELLDQDKVDKNNSNWWFTDNNGLWGDQPFLHLGERHWLPDKNIAVEQFFIIDLEHGKTMEINLSDQTYAVSEMVQELSRAGFETVDVYKNWSDLPVYDEGEWIVYVAKK